MGNFNIDPKLVTSNSTRGVDAATGAIVLAAGRGSRMRSDLPKVMHPLNGRPMITYIVDALSRLGFAKTAPQPVFVVGFGAESVERAAGALGIFIRQTELLGTGDAARVGLSALPAGSSRVLLIHGDEPMIEVATFWEMLDKQIKTNAAVVLLTGEVSDTSKLGRVIRDDHGTIVDLVQENELAPSQRSVREINFGAYVFERMFMQESLPQLEKHDSGEYYLTDLVRFAIGAGRSVDAVTVPHPDDQMGINDLEQLLRAERFLRRMETVDVGPSKTQ